MSNKEKIALQILNKINIHIDTIITDLDFRDNEMKKQNRINDTYLARLGQLSICKQLQNKIMDWEDDLLCWNIY